MSYSLFSEMSSRFESLKKSGMVLPPIDELSSSYLIELLAFTEYVLDIERDKGNDVPYGTGLYESDVVRHWYSLFDSEPTPLLTEPVNMGDISDTLCAKMTISLHCIKTHADFLKVYVNYYEARCELSKLYYNVYEDGSINQWDNDYLGTTHLIVNSIIQHQNRDYTTLPMLKYNDVTKKLELTYQLDASEVAGLMRYNNH